MNTKIPEFLIEMSKRMNTDDNRCTSHPFWQVRCKRDIPAPDEFSDEFVLYDTNQSHEFYHSVKSESEDDCIDYLMEYYPEWCDKWASGYDYKCGDYESPLECFRDCFSFDSSSDFPIDIERIYVQEVEEVVSTHLTEYDAKWFIKRKQHDYPTLYTYVESAYWSPEFKQLQDWIKSLANEGGQKE